MFKEIFKKTIGGLMAKEIHGRVKGKNYNYSLSFEDIRLPWKEMTNLGNKAISFPKNTPEFSWDKKFISSDFDGGASAMLSVGVFNLNHSTTDILISYVKDGNKIDKKELENTDAILTMLRLGKLLQESILNNKKVGDDLYKGMEGSMDSFLNLFYFEEEDTKRTTLKSYIKNFYGLEAWLKISRGVEGDQWLYTMYVPAGGIIYSIRSLVLFEKLSDKIKDEIEQIAHSFRFEIVPIAIDELEDIANKIEVNKNNPKT